LRRRGPRPAENTSDGKAWTENGFRSSWGKARDKAGLAGLTFHDLRVTAVTRLFMAGATEAEIAVFTGLSLADVRAILEKHYFHRDPRIAENAGAKLETWSKGEQILPTGRTRLTKGTRNAQ
jgi:integrase